MEQGKDSRFIPMTSAESGKGHELRGDVFYYTNQIVNVVFVGEPEADSWVMVDAGMPGSGKELLKVAEERFCKGCRPRAIVLTHGHFDHVGSIVELVKQWNVPVYAHSLEFPYLSGQKSYPEPDVTVEGGLLAKISSVYPNEPIDIREVLRPLPEDHTVPGMPGWRWIPTPGHSPGHVSFFREHDRVVIAGDAFVTVRQDSFYKVLTQQTEVNGPPRYLTTDWASAKRSVELIAGLQPGIAVTGHGPAMQGDELKAGLSQLVQNWEQEALPAHGKYVPGKPHDER